MTSQVFQMLLDRMSEEEWSVEVRHLAAMGGWCGIHVRKSLDPATRYAALQGVHTTARGHGHDDVRGMPDWIFCKPGQPPIWAELKTVHGVLTDDQRRWQEMVSGVVWRPCDYDLVRSILVGDHVTRDDLLDSIKLRQKRAPRRSASRGARSPVGRNISRGAGPF